MSKPVILVVEDDANFRRVLQYQLTEAGYKTAVAEKAEKALELFSEHRYQVVLTDLNLPDLDGLQATQRILAERP